jgi:hypothetical protein
LAINFRALFSSTEGHTFAHPSPQTLKFLWLWDRKEFLFTVGGNVNSAITEEGSVEVPQETTNKTEVKHLLCKCKALNSNFSITKNKKKMKETKNRPTIWFSDTIRGHIPKGM